MIIVGDVHGEFDKYINRVKNADYSLCVGDVGFDYSPLSDLDPDRHKIIAGNHDNYDNLSAHFLDDFGVHRDIFYVRGAWSIDKQYRIEGVSWWRNEELTYAEMLQCITLYNLIKPDIVVTHEVPWDIKQILIKANPGDCTSRGLQMMLNLHRPKLWIHGHHHVNYSWNVEGTNFVGLGILGTYILEN